jgi:hypothetical protein
MSANVSSFDISLTAAQSMGRFGSKTQTGTSAATGGPWCAIVVVSACVFTTLTGSHTGFSGVTYPAGHILVGNFTAVTLASGTVDLYNAQS